MIATAGTALPGVSQQASPAWTVDWTGPWGAMAWWTKGLAREANWPWRPKEMGRLDFQGQHISFWLHTVVESSFKITSQELHSEESKYILGLPWYICFPSCAASAQVHCGQVQGQLGFASLNLDLALVDLRGVSGGLPDATPALVVQVKTWTWPELPEQGSVMYTFVTVWLIIMWAEYLCCKNTHIYVQCHSNIQGRCIFQWKHTLIIGQRQCRLRTLDQILWKNITLRVCHQYRPQGEFFNAFFVWISDS